MSLIFIVGVIVSYFFFYVLSFYGLLYRNYKKDISVLHNEVSFKTYLRNQNEISYSLLPKGGPEWFRRLFWMISFIVLMIIIFGY